MAIKIETGLESTAQAKSTESCSRYAHRPMSTELLDPPPPIFLPMDWALPNGVHAVCTTRLGGVSHPPFDALNLGDHVGDLPDDVAENRNRLASRLGGAYPVFLSQVHGTGLVHLSRQTPQGTPADACVATDPLVACTIMVADCLPLLFTDVRGRAVAAAHAGWRGLAAGVLEKTVESICASARVEPKNIRAWLGPCIGPDAFEVGDDVRDTFCARPRLGAEASAEFFKPHPLSPRKWLADLAGLARLRLQASGVMSLSGNDSSVGWCTVSQPSIFFSYRRSGITGRFAVAIWRT